MAIIRLEQIFPFPVAQIQNIISKYSNATEMFWVQEEPTNMGVWPYILSQMRRDPIEVIARKESSSTATGYNKQHVRQQEYIVNTAFEMEQAKAVVKKTVAKNAPIKKAATTKAAVKKVEVKKAAAKKAPAKKAVVKKLAKAAATKTVAKKAPVKKVASKKVAPKSVKKSTKKK